MQDLNVESIDVASSESPSEADISFDGLMEILKSEPIPFIRRSHYEGAGDRIRGIRQTIYQNDLEQLVFPPSTSYRHPNSSGGGKARFAQLEKVTGTGGIRMNSKAEESIEPGEIVGSLELREEGEVLDVGGDLGDIYSILNDALTEMKLVEKKWQASETALRNENDALKNKLEDEARRMTLTRSALDERRMRVASLEGELDAVLLAAKKERREVDVIRSDAHHEIQKMLRAFDAILVTMKVQLEKVDSKTKEVKRRGNAQVFLRRVEQTKLQLKLDFANASVLQEKSNFESVLAGKRKAEEWLTNVRGELEELRRERDIALDAVDKEKAKLAEECEARLQTTTLLTAARCKRRRLEHDLMVAGEEVAEEKLRMEGAHEKEMDEAQCESMRLKLKLVRSVRRRKMLEAELLTLRNHVKVEETGHQAVVKNLEEEKEKSQAELVSLRNEVTEIETAKLAVRKNLEEERERSQCQICLENPKDSIAFPCLHMNFCFSCLEAHRTRMSTCPSCRTTISGVLKCVLGT